MPIATGYKISRILLGHFPDTKNNLHNDCFTRDEVLDRRYCS